MPGGRPALLARSVGLRERTSLATAHRRADWSARLPGCGPQGDGAPAPNRAHRRAPARDGPHLRSRSTFRTPTFGRSSSSRSKSTSGSTPGRVQSTAPPRSPDGRAARIRSHTLRQWAVELARSYDTVCCERMNVSRLRRSARGTHEKHGKNVSVQRELNRRLANAAPGEQRPELEAACERHGSEYIESPARISSNFCPECGHCSAENRKSQARFRCQESGHTENADANAARNHLLWGTSEKHRAAVRRSGERKPKRQADRGNPGKEAPKANRTDAGRQRDPLQGPTRFSERSLPPGVNPGTKGGASETAANAETDGCRSYC